MAMRKIGSRRIAVNGHFFLWRIRRTPTYCQGAFASVLCFAVEHIESGAVLSVVSDGPRPDNWLGIKGTIVTPKMVADCIQQAITSGWNPTESRKPYRLDLRKGRVTNS
jgi:hypothetical protein